jgi:NitT/TauT family transport system substrate-binding protein
MLPAWKLIGALAAGVLLAACGGAAPAGPSSAAPTAAAPSSAAAVSATQAASSAAKPSAVASTAAAGASAKPAASGLVTLKMGPPSTDPNYSLPFAVAKAKGYFAAEGLDVQMELIAGNLAAPALLKGEIDFAAHSSAMQATMQGAGSMKAVFSPYSTSTLNLIVNADKIKQPKDLVGQPVAVDTLGNAQDQATRLTLQSIGVDPQQVDIIPLQNSSNRIAAMVSGRIVATADNPGVVAQILPRGNFKIIADSSKVYAIPWSGYGVTAAFISDRRPALEGWMRAMVKSLQYIVQNPDDSASILAQQTGIDPAAAKAAVPLLVKVISTDDPGGWTLEGIETQIKFIKRAINLDRDVPIDEVSDLGPLRAAQRSLGIQCKGGYQC